MVYRVERDIAGRTLNIEAGKLAFQANAAVTVRYGDTMVLATVCMADHPREGIDFLPLTVDVEERHYSMGKIPGSFFRREGRPSQEATLTARLTDRPIRPLFPKGLRNDIQVVVTVFSTDQQNAHEVLSIIGASAALSLSDIPWEGPVAATRVGSKDGQWLINPTFEELETSNVHLVVAGTRDAVMMVEAGAWEVPEGVMLEAIRRGQEVNLQVIEMIDDLTRQAGKPKIDLPHDTDRASAVEAAVSSQLNGRLQAILEAGEDKIEREAALAALEAEVKERLTEEYDAREVAKAFQDILKRLVRARILEKGIRPDGRQPEEIRPIQCEVGILPRTHGSGLFIRGLTQVLSIATLASPSMEQRLDTLSPQESKRFLHHYNFPPYSTGEVKRVGSPGRREIGHGALAERALLPTLPSKDDFPYTIRLVSEVLSSNGSTSMASVCGSTLAMMDAGVPIKAPVAGVAMGLVMGEEGQHAVLTDIQGIEDMLGDMDFKVAGTAKGVTALQMDIKARGLRYDILQNALEQARVARLFILDRMLEVLPSARPDLSPYAPRLFRLVIPVEKIGAVIGSGGRTIRAIVEETGATVDVDDQGVVVIGSPSEEQAQKAMDRVLSLTKEVTVGDVFTGKVTRLTSFGAFVEILPGKDGLVRNVDLGDLEEDVTVGQEVTVMVTEVDSLGRINLSRRAITGDGRESQETRERPYAPRQRPPDRRPPPRRPYQGGQQGPGMRRGAPQPYRPSGPRPSGPRYGQGPGERRGGPGFGGSPRR
ncbi:MAG: polyribonucleotide nucleotidyltransferase [Dehalococcoidia bacterium]